MAHRSAVPVLELLRTMSFGGHAPAWGLRPLHAPLRLTDEDVAWFERAHAAASSPAPEP
jgi:hypothetical protein